jgi:hypothetical protein
MDRTRKATREGNEITLQHKSQRETLLDEQWFQEKLAELQASIELLKQSPQEADRLEQRVKHFGECGRIEGETSGQYYEKLRRWLDRDIPKTKLPLHPPRQNEG